MKKCLRIFIIIAFMILLLSVLAACNDFLSYGKHVVLWRDNKNKIHTITVKKGKHYSIAIPEREGYIFNGLFDEEVGGTQYVGSTGFSIARWNEKADKNLFPQWSPKNITIFFDACDGEGSESVRNILYDSDIENFSIPLKEGHNFLGWYSSKNENAVSYSNAEGIPKKTQMTYSNYPMAKARDEIKLYAKWETMLITVTFNSNKESINSSLASTTVIMTKEIPWGSSIEMYIPDDEAFSVFETPDNSIRGILRWFGFDSHGNTFNGVVTEEITLYAYWAPAIIFDTQGGREKEPLVALGNSIISIDAPERAGFAFQGWEDEAGNTVMLTTMPGRGVKLKATWEIITYTISYNYNGGKEINDDPIPVEYTVADTILLPTNIEKDYYEFVGWYGNVILSGRPITKIATGSTGDKTFYARWTPISWQITYELSGGVSLDNPDSYTIESDMITLEDATRGGCIFKGWYSESNSSGTKYTEIIPSQEKRNIKLYAAWEIITYTISYNYNGGSVIHNAPAQYNVETPTFSLPTNTTKQYHDFAGWYENIACSGSRVTYITKGSTGDKTFYAKWQGKEYTITYKTAAPVPSPALTIKHGANYPQTHTYNIPTTLVNPINTERDFLGWFTNSAGTGSPVTLLSATGYTANITLYAKWSELINIYNSTDFAKIATNKSGKYLLKNDINLGNWNSPFNFSGVLDGSGNGRINCITFKQNLTNTQDYYGGLFTYAQGATFKNLKLNVDIAKTNVTKATGKVGGLVGSASKYPVTILRVAVSGKINIRNGSGAGHIGGIAGAIYCGTIDQCVNKASIIGEDKTSRAGGITGFAQSSDGTITISDCYNEGYIEAGSNYTTWGGGGKAAGGIIGQLLSDTNAIKINRCYNNSYIALNRYITGGGWTEKGGIAGFIYLGTSTSFSCSNCHWDSNKESWAVYSKPSYSGCTARTSLYGYNYPGWSTSIWRFNERDNPRLIALE